MKKYFILAAAAIAMASCSNDEGTSVANDGTIRLTTDVSKAGTRTIDQTIQATQIVNGGRVFAEFTSSVAADATSPATGWAASQTTATATYTADGSGNLNGATVKFPDDGATVSVRAWYPNFAAVPVITGGSETVVSVQADQSTEANYAVSDYLYGTSSSFVKADIANPIKIYFQHMLSKINVKVTKSDGSSLVGAKVVFGAADDMYLDGKLGTGYSVATTGTTQGTVTMATALDAAGTASCIIIPQTLTSGKDLITITDAEGKNYTYKLADNKTFAEKKAYTYNVTIAEEGVIILSEQITEWEYETPESVIAKE